MTKEEREKAIDLLDNLLGIVEDNQDNDYDKALKMGIESLRKEPSVDSVNRATVLNLINDVQRADGFKDYSQYEYLFDQVDNMPSVTPTRKTGKWTNGNPICPCCGEDKFKDLDADIWADWQPKYCPNCGAEMESE